jgi:uncharacterized protein
MQPAIDFEGIVAFLRGRMTGILGIYAFGSRVTYTARPDSDLDLAVLVEGYADPAHLWEWTGPLADLAHCPVDLLDLRAASTVMQYQILTTCKRLFAQDMRADLFEVAMLNEKLSLDESRAGLIGDITRSGRIYDR